jgi:hypothetical protein
VRNIGTYLLSVILIAGTLSAVISMATIQWLYPDRGRGQTGTTQGAVTDTPKADALPSAPTSGPETVSTAPKAVTPTLAKPAQATPPAATPEEKLALDFLLRAAGGDAQGAAALTEGLSTDFLKEQITRHVPVPQRVATLPGAPGSTVVLIWATTGTELARIQYQVTIQKDKVHALKGPLAPEGGFAPFALTMLGEDARPLDMAAHKGRALLLIAPRAPEPGLAELLTELQTTYAPKGIDVALVLDIKSPDWLTAARAAGYKGPVWRVKARLDDVPLVARGTLLGAYGVLVDRAGFAVASLAALEPLHYNLPDETPASIAPMVFRAYGLLP